MKIALNQEQYIEYLTNKKNMETLETMKEILQRTQSEDKNTFILNILNELADDLYLLKIELEELYNDKED